MLWDIAGVDPDRLDPAFLQFDHERAAQKARFQGEFFPAQMFEVVSGLTFLEFFQFDRDGHLKGIVELDLATLPP